MKQLLKKNQVIIAALAIMIAVAGYINVTQGKIGNKDKAQQVTSDNTTTLNGKGEIAATSPTPTATSGDQKDAETLNNNELEITDVESENSDSQLVDKNKEKDVASSSAGDAVLASNSISSEFFASAKLTREQTRAKNKETLLEVINNKNISEEAKQEAINEMIELTSISEKENVTETLLEAKGFLDAIVTVTDDTVDVIVNSNNITEQQMAQIEDIVKRKTGISAENIVISPAKVLQEDTKSEE